MKMEREATTMQLMYQQTWGFKFQMFFFRKCWGVVIL